MKRSQFLAIPIFLMLTVFLMTVGCSQSQIRRKGGGWKMDGTPELRLHRYLSHGWDFELGETLDEVKRNLGSPIREREERLEPEDPANLDTVHVLEYSGLKVRIYRVVSTQPKDILVSVTLESTRYPTLWSIGIDTDRKKVLSTFGEPSAAGPNHVFYDLDGDTLTFTFSGTKVRSVQWERYVD